MLNPDRILFIDTETGGTDPSLHSLLTVGLVTWEDGSLSETFEIAIDDGHLFATKEALEINKIDLKKHREISTSPTNAIKQIIQYTTDNFSQSEKVTLAGHNISFDIRFLRYLFESKNYDFSEYFSHRSIDTSSILHFLFFSGKLSSKIVSSSEAFEYFGIEVQGRHTALGDAIATAELFSKLIDFIR